MTYRRLEMIEYTTRMYQFLELKLLFGFGIGFDMIIKCAIGLVCVSGPF